MFIKDEMEGGKNNNMDKEGIKRGRRKSKEDSTINKGKS